ncbi:serine/threonine-protein phosphatase 7 long form homolog [Rutidosis leptorrhynchoides]|uniref:serine/threonine-protein phosphatase 7 long form homolog n=1 Tax=Rutidosis leptorrhynchoides TaxID=125765 RepID=UPI003A9A060C
MEYDHHLLTALAERWRPETHSFHLSIGEATITLQDVGMLLGLCVDGLPITGNELYPSDIDEYLERLLGFCPKRDGKTAIRLASLRQHLELHRDRVKISNLEALQRARCHVAFLLAGCFFSNKSQNKIDLFVLRLLEDPEFLWTPYVEHMHTLPDGCRHGEHIWRSRTYLHYYYIVEGHYPDRVMRQFGCRQVIPDDPLNETETQILHRIKRSSHHRNWERDHAIYVQEWHSQANRVVEGTPIAYPEAPPPYRSWYHSKTVQFIQDPSHEPDAGGYHGHSESVHALSDELSHHM